MAVESTPERSFSDLFRSSRAAEATTGCGRSPRCGVVIMARPPRVGQKVGDPCERLVGLGVEDMQDRPDQERMARLLPMVAPLQSPFGIDQDVGHLLAIP